MLIRRNSGGRESADSQHSGVWTAIKDRQPRMDFHSQTHVADEDLLELLGLEDDRPRGRVKNTQDVVQKTLDFVRPLEIVPESEFDELEALTTSKWQESKHSSSMMSKNFEEEAQGPFGLLPTSQYAKTHPKDRQAPEGVRSKVSQIIGTLEGQIAINEGIQNFENLKDAQDRAKRYGHYRVNTIILQVGSVELVNDVVVLELTDGIRSIKASLSARFVETLAEGGDNKSFLWGRLGLEFPKPSNVPSELQQMLSYYPLMRGRQTIQLKNVGILEEGKLLRIEDAPLIWFEADESVSLLLVGSNIKQVLSAP